jgi:hypothetical protein
MAMELFVLSDKQLESMEEWQAAADGEGYPLRLDDARPIGTLKGFLPVQMGNTKTGFECSHWQADKFMREKSDFKFGHQWKYLITFRWGGDLDQVLAAWMAATAYAKATNGIVFDEVEGTSYTAMQAGEIVRDIQGGLPKVEAILREFIKS